MAGQQGAGEYFRVSDLYRLTTWFLILRMAIHSSVSRVDPGVVHGRLSMAAVAFSPRARSRRGKSLSPRVACSGQVCWRRLQRAARSGYLSSCATVCEVNGAAKRRRSVVSRCVHSLRTTLIRNRRRSARLYSGSYQCPFAKGDVMDGQAPQVWAR